VANLLEHITAEPPLAANRTSKWVSLFLKSRHNIIIQFNKIEEVNGLIKGNEDR
jgi:hypothetical protein